MRDYIQTKARLFICIGADRYRRADFFHHPDAMLSEGDLAAVDAGMRQFAVGRGFSADNPLVGICMDGLEQVATTLHFDIVHDDAATGSVRITHVVSGRAATLWYQTSGRWRQSSPLDAPDLPPDELIERCRLRQQEWMRMHCELREWLKAHPPEDDLPPPPASEQRGSS